MEKKKKYYTMLWNIPKKKKSWIIHCRRRILWYVNCISIKLLKNPMNDIVTVVVQLLSCVLFFVTPWTAAYQAPLYSTMSQSLLKCNPLSQWCYLTCHPLLLLPSIFPSIRVFQWVGSSHQVAKVLELTASASVLPMNRIVRVTFL